MADYDLTILCTVDTEKDLRLLDHFWTSLVQWQWLARDNRAQVILVSQRSPIHIAGDMANWTEASRHWPWFDVVRIDQDWIGDYPAWDVMDGFRQAWPLVGGEYVAFLHPEMLWLPGRLTRTIDWLRRERPDIALGNLRRPGCNLDEQRRNDESLSALVTDALVGRDFDRAADLAESIPTTTWAWWTTEPKPTDAPVWREDVFFARRSWLDAWRFLDHAERQIFQDVYDLMGAALGKMWQYKVRPPCPRILRSDNELLHLAHPRDFSCFTAEIRDWFLADAARWEGTILASPAHWARLLAARELGWEDYRPVKAIRHDRLGTVQRYAGRLGVWLANGGKDELAAYYENQKRVQGSGFGVQHPSADPVS